MLWGPPAPGAVEALPAGDLLERAWSRGRAWALIPFEALEPRWKVLEVDGASPLHKDFDPGAYPLSVPISLSGQVDWQPCSRDLDPGEQPRPLTPDRLWR